MAGAHVHHKLSAVRVKALKAPGKYEDGGGLRLVIGPTGTKRWVVRITVAGRRLERGLGAYPDITLDAARTAAAKARRAAEVNLDIRSEEQREALASMTFRDMFRVTLAQREKQLSNAKHLKQWSSTMETYVFPTIGSTPVAEVSTAQVLKVLTPIWFTKPETAKRVMQRMEAVFKSAIVRGARKAASPCIGVADELGTKHRVVNHHASMPWGDVPNLIQLLHGPAPRRMRVTSLALEFLILTATRSGETRGAAWSEFDTERALWVIPPKRMKAREGHRVPLSKRCLEILAQLSAAHPRSELVFPSRTGKPLSDMTLTKLLRDETIEATPHGFRSSFKVWASECAKVPHEVSEAALAHSLGSKVVAAYLRTDFLEERRPVMQAWADYCLGGRAQGTRSAEAGENAQDDA